MKIKVATLLSRLEKIERDLAELERLKESIQDDRNYANRLRASLVDETVRLKDLQGRLLSAVVKNPPESLAILPSAALSSTATENPEVILPGKQTEAASTGQKEAAAASEKPAPKEKKEKGKKGEDSKPNFQFRYN